MKKKVASAKKPPRKSPAAKVNGRSKPATPKAAAPSEEPWTLRLYVAGQSTRSITAIANLRRICAEHLPDGCNVEVIDLMRNPELAKVDQIVALPTLVRRLPAPVRRIIGDLSSTEKVLLSMELNPQ
jgi:circadian clock protein KaiB